MPRLAPVWTAAMFLVACQRPVAPRPAPFALSEHPEALLHWSLPDNNRPGGQPTPDAVNPGPFQRRWEQDGRVEYICPLPVTQVDIGFSRGNRPDGMTLQAGKKPVRFAKERTSDPALPTWSADTEHLYLRLPAGHPPPRSNQFTLSYPRATTWEHDLNLATSTQQGEQFLLRRQTLEGEAWHGVYLPAPGQAAWRVQVPEGAVFTFDARILPPGVRPDTPSDGAYLTISVVQQGTPNQLIRLPLQPGDWTHQRLDLSPWQGQQVELRLSSEPGDSPDLDYVFLANPTVYQPRRRPRRLIMVFVDTLRRDHLGLYGYERDTSPKLDKWAENALVFQQARSCSPWTLPSVRSLLSGHLPEEWEQVPTLPQRLADAGFITAGFTANAYLTPAFGMGEDWSVYGHRLLEPAQAQVNKALAFLQANKDRDSAVFIQFMEPHLPYEEPRRYRHMWAGERPSYLDQGMSPHRLRKLRTDNAQRQAVRDYMVGRYDQTIRYVDDQVSRLFREAHIQRAHTVVAFFSDHGEEFWDHGDVEHGHSLYDELLRVPLLLQGAGVPRGEIQAPVSLLDLPATLLDLLDLPSGGTAGRSLMPLWQDPDAANRAFQERPQGFGHTLLGPEAWGVLSRGHKWWTRDSRQVLFNLQTDPGETVNLVAEHTAELGGYADDLAQALGRPVRTVWRVEGAGSGKTAAMRRGSVSLSLPRGIQQAWGNFDPWGTQAQPALHDNTALMESSPGLALAREFYVLPQGDPMDPRGLTLTVVRGETQWTASWEGDTISPTDASSPQVLLQAGRGNNRFTVSLHEVPLPAAESLPSAPDSALEALRVLGYVE